MRYFVTTAILLTTLFAKAQIVNIPDTNFKHWLLMQPAINTNNDSEIQQTEAEVVTEINYWPGFTDTVRDITGIRSFRNLRKIRWNLSKQSVMDISGLDQLSYLEVIGDSLRAINLAGCSNLDTVVFSGNKQLLNIDLSPSTRIKAISFDSNRSLENINFGVQDSLLFLGIIDFVNYSNLLQDTLDMSAYKNLQSISLSNCTFKYINLSGLDKLTFVRINDQIFGNPRQLRLEKVDLTGCSNLSTLDLWGNENLKELNLTGCSTLPELQLNSHPYSLTSLDISTCYNLTYLSLFTRFLRKLNMKNGIRNRLDLEYHQNIDICVDDFETDLLNFNPADSINISPYCSFFPGGTYNTIKGKASITNNNTCDSTNRGLMDIPIRISDGQNLNILRFTASSGEYAHYSGAGTFSVVPYFPYPYFSISPTTGSVSFDTANSLTATRDFCIQPQGIHHDLEITFLPILHAARPGFDAAYTLVYKNRGTTTLSGNVAVNFDNTKMNFVSASENVTTQSSGQLLWNYNNLQPFERRTINVTFSLLPPPVNNIGDTINYLAVITPSDNDETGFDNIFILPQRVVGSFDPNDKTCFEGGKLDISKIGDYLHYQIRFQNEGTDTAFNIVVADTLSDNLDWNTFEFIGSSHACEPQLKNNKAEFIFKNINLPYKAIDEPASNGWVAFKIKPKPSVVIGDSLNNSAAIYFDFNMPVITNTATTIVTSSSTPVPVKLEYFSANKKENTNQLNWKASCTYGNAGFNIERSDDGIHFKTIGNITATAVRCQLPFSFTDNNPVNGKNYYRLKITDADGKSFYSKILVTGNNKAGLEITAVANNTVYLNSNKQQAIQLTVIAADGKEVLKQKQTVGPGSNNITLQIKNVSKGIYSLVIYTEKGETITKRFIK